MLGSAPTSACRLYLGLLWDSEFPAAHQQTVEGTVSPGVAALQESWRQWNIPSQEKKTLQRTDEWETSGCRVTGTLGALAPPRGVISELLGVTVWFCDAIPRSLKRSSDSGWQMVTTLPISTKSFPRILTVVARHLPSARPTTLRNVVDLLMAMCLLPLLRFGVVRTSTLTLEGRNGLSLRALSTADAADQLRIIELNAGIGGLRRSVELLERVPDVCAASDDDPACYRALETAWPTTVRIPQDLSHFEAAALCLWEEDQHKFPMETYSWDNGLVRWGGWRYPHLKKGSSFWVSGGTTPPPYFATSAVQRHPESVRTPDCQFQAARRRSVSWRSLIAQSVD